MPYRPGSAARPDLWRERRIALGADIILAGTWLVQEFHWVLFGAFLVATVIKMLMFAEVEPDLSKHPLLNWIKRHAQLTPGYRSEKFWVRESGVRCSPRCSWC